MIVSEGFYWLHANGEWVEYFEVNSLAKRLNLPYAKVWNYVQKGARSDEQLPKQLIGNVASKKKKENSKEKSEFASKHNPVIKTVKRKVEPVSMEKQDYLKTLEAEKERYSYDWNNDNQESAWQLIERKE